MKRTLCLSLLALTSAVVGQTYVNGPFVTHPAGFGCVAPIPAGDGSILENLAPMGLSIFGFGAAGALRIADDFTVPAGESWTLNTIKVYAYQTLVSNATTSTINAGNYRIWCGEPGNGGVIVADFSLASQFVSSTWTGAYRVTAAIFNAGTQCAVSGANSNRKIMDVVMNGNSIVLPPGQYWLDYNMTATGTPFCPPISILGQKATGNAKQFNTAWVPLTSGVAPVAQGMPFEITYSSAPVAAASEFQANSPACSVDWNGSRATACSLTGAAISSVCVGSNTTLNFSSSASLGWELAYSFLPAVGLSAGGLPTPGFQTVNINLLDPNLGYLNALTFPAFGLPLGGNPGSFSFAAPPLGTLTVQAIAVGAPHPEGFALSQAAQLNVVVAPPPVFPVNGPILDESAVTLQLDGPQACAGLGIPYFGTLQTQMHVYSNGYVGFGPFALNDFSPTVLEAQLRPQVGIWEDLNPGTVGSGNITITNPATGQIQVNYNGVWRFTTGSATNAVGYSLLFETNGNISFLGMNNVTASPAAVTQWIGISPGNLTVPGSLSADFTAGPVTVPAGTMRYDFNTGAALTVPTITTIALTPDGLNGYLGTAF